VSGACPRRQDSLLQPAFPLTHTPITPLLCQLALLFYPRHTYYADLTVWVEKDDFQVVLMDPLGGDGSADLTFDVLYCAWSRAVGQWGFFSILQSAVGKRAASVSALWHAGPAC
jgi:hypothetical protein